MKAALAVSLIAIFCAACERQPTTEEIEAAKQATQREAERAKKEREFLTPSGNSQTRTQTTGRLSDSR